MDYWRKWKQERAERDAHGKDTRDLLSILCDLQKSNKEIADKISAGFNQIFWLLIVIAVVIVVIK